MNRSSANVFCSFMSGLLLILCLQSCVSPSEPDAPLISRALLFDNPARAQARISPDGNYVSWLEPYEDVLNIWIAPRDDLSQAHPLTRFAGHGIGFHSWSRDSKYVFFERDKDGDENTHIYAGNVIDRSIRDLTPVEDGIKAELVAKSWTHPGELVIAMNLRDNSRFDLFRVSIASGERRFLAENKDYSAWLIDDQLEPRFAIADPPTGGARVETLSGEVVLTIPLDDYINSYVMGLDRAGDNIYLIDSRDRNVAAITVFDPAKKELGVIAEPVLADVDDIFFHPKTSVPLAYRSEYLKPLWTVLDPSVQTDFDLIEAELGTMFKITSNTEDMSVWTLYSERSDKPGTYFSYDRKAGTITRLFAKNPKLENQPLQPMQALDLRARDGRKLVSYLTLPPGSDANGDGVPEKPVPMVLNVHGGPWSRDSYGMNMISQWLANRGYAVLSVNYRGSLGFGKDHLNAGVGEFAGKMHDDLIDGVDWAVASGIADPDRVAIMGGSYGGYAALVGLSFTPDVFACGVDRVGLTNLVTAIESFPDYWKPFLESDWYHFVGDPSVPEERADMLARSPISRVEAIRAPVLITQGENDPRVVKAESDQMVAALLKAGKHVTYLNFPDEGHGLRRPENRFANFAVTEAFLAACLGGRAEPIGDELGGSSIQILEGAEYVGLNTD